MNHSIPFFKRSILSVTVVLALSIHYPSGSLAFESEVWPGEGTPWFKPKVDTGDIYSEPSVSSKIVEKRNLTKGQRIHFSEVRIRTINPGKVGVFFDVELSVYKQLAADYLSINDIHNLGKPEPLHLRAGDSINYLQYLGEGTCVIQFHGEMMICARCYWLSKGSRFSNHFNYQSPVKIERWINLGKKGQNPGAWLQVTSETMESNFILSP